MHRREEFCHSTSKNSSYRKTYESIQNCTVKDRLMTVLSVKMNIGDYLVSVTRGMLKYMMVWRPIEQYVGI